MSVVGAAPAASPTWTEAFGETRPALYLQATYPDAQGKAQTLEFWRDASGRVVRRTGGRSELHLTPSKDGEDLYQLRNLLSRTAYDVHRVNLFRVGVFTDRWSVQHLLDRPVGPSVLTRMARGEQTAAGRCEWWRVAAGVKVSEVCWSTRYGLPLLLKSGGHTVLSVQQVKPLGSFPAAAVPKDWQEYDADEDLAPD
ncbi:hypothetical protein [Deinococcus altitudinis]|uniref:hypothetical protein n=1 Tax=Deinococcus altitudinis TaxID=468914 RepID=UPI0038911AA9